MYTFKKEERLCNKKLIDGLFHNGSSFLCYPFRASWALTDGEQQFPVQIVFSVAKKRYKRAVDRNLVKRRMREAYRLSKQSLLYDVLDGAGKKLVLSISYIGKEISPYDLFEKKMIKLLNQLAGEAIK
ncbi:MULTISPECIES: ribonuclease P protein component [unclassified Mucilaginibacter]|uniref:ribonuclease P protein component n=1 Tax=unclassified Mucilaginibacter TaxID=2617802 RepID=UPI002AC913A5|nr:MULTISPECIES: ribonuclease P protein component [unclassified Mucilaginibacter]MEB0260233.1 ribonuclease P protein component [Mucilaginibacter sp. 10I4]MEB0277356.1 ribonuclease P protein component [Mucilaginibacter sp. 10B2]MEB0300162.1 ribonuclease P protein component [Mucilaginibacter sp. 5C4]WPX25480.1 ribonuclease P protein component [Mucilaginibacter sp. 5C4]